MNLNQKQINRLLKLDCFNDYEKDQLKMLKSKFSEPVSILFKGEFSTGKSSIINKILKRDLLPYDEPEVNAIIVLIRYGEKEKSIIYYKNGNKKEVSVEESAKYINQKQIAEEAISIRKIEIYINNSFLQSKQLIDTPGLNTVFYDHIKKTQQFELFGDFVIYTVLAESGLKEKPDFEELNKMENEGKNCIVVFTRIDDLKNQENVQNKIEEANKKLEEWNLHFKVFGLTIKEANESLNSSNKLEHVKFLIDQIDSKDKNENINREVKKLVNFKIESMQNRRQQFIELEKELNNKIEDMMYLEKLFKQVTQQTIDNFNAEIEKVNFKVGRFIESILRTGDKKASKDFSKQIQVDFNFALQKVMMEGRIAIDTIFEENIEKFYEIEIKNKEQLKNKIESFKIDNLKAKTEFDIPDNNVKIILDYLKENKGNIVKFLKNGFDQYIEATEKKVKKDIIKSLSNKLSDKEKRRMAKKLSADITEKYLRKTKIAGKVLEGVIRIGDLVLQIIENNKKNQKIEAEKDKVFLYLERVKKQLILGIKAELRNYYEETYERIKEIYYEEIKNLRGKNKFLEEFEDLQEFYAKFK